MRLVSLRAASGPRALALLLVIAAGLGACGVDDDPKTPVESELAIVFNEVMSSEQDFVELLNLGDEAVDLLRRGPEHLAVQVGEDGDLALPVVAVDLDRRPDGLGRGDVPEFRDAPRTGADPQVVDGGRAVARRLQEADGHVEAVAVGLERGDVGAADRDPKDRKSVV